MTIIIIQDVADIVKLMCRLVYFIMAYYCTLRYLTFVVEYLPNINLLENNDSFYSPYRNTTSIQRDNKFILARTLR